MANTERSVRLWANWHLVCLGGRDYELQQLVSGEAWMTHRTYWATDDQTALEKAKDLIYTADRKSGPTKD